MSIIYDRINLAKAGRLEDTPQGYLWCRDVPIARTGTMDYAPFEVPEIPAVPGQRTVTVERTADEVFSPDAIASFRGMPLTDDHPDEFVTAENHRQHRIGDIHDPRRGEGEHADCLVADLLVTDPAAISLIKSRTKRELSCGYDAAYTDVRPGYGRQINIRGNHVSLVDAGRAGSRIRIRDRLMSSLPLVRKRSRVADALLSVFGSKDAAERTEQKRLLDEAMDVPDDKDGDGHTVNVVVHPPQKEDDPKPEPKPGDDAPNLEPKPDEDKGMTKDEMEAAIATAVSEKIGAAVEEACAPLKEEISSLREALEDVSDPDDAGMQDAILRADVLAPGLTRPARDSKPGSKAHRDGLVGFKRLALKQALTTDSGRIAINAVAGHSRPDLIDRASSDAVTVMFNAASQMMADTAAVATAATASVLASATSGYVRDDKGAVIRAMTPTDLQNNADAFYKRGK